MLTGAAEQNADHRHRSSLCTRQQRPRERRAAKKRAELPPPHWAPLAAEKRPRDYQVSAHAALVRCTAVCNQGEVHTKTRPINTQKRARDRRSCRMALCDMHGCKTHV